MHNEELHDMYHSQSTSTILTSGMR